MTETEDYDKSATPTPHGPSHQKNGGDEISVAGLAGELTAEQKSAWAKVSGKPTTFAPVDHTHQSSGQGDKLDHGLALVGLADDDHPQYPLLTGRAGGQTILGGTQEGENLNLSSTTHPTKGLIKLGPNLYWDETNRRLRIGTLNVNNRLGTPPAIYLDAGNTTAFPVSIEGEGTYVGFDVNGYGPYSQPFIQLNRDTVRIFTINAETDNLTINFRDGTAVGTIILTLHKTTLAVEFNGPVGIGGVANANAMLDVASTTKAFIPPRMTTTQKNAIPSPVAGMIVFDTTLNKLCVRGAAAWETITSA